MSCPHLSDYKNKVGFEPYEIICELFVHNVSNTCKKMCTPCFTCPDENNYAQLLACLHCVYIGCFKTHVVFHHHKNGHRLYVEFTYGNIYCVSCKDFVYDKDFEMILKQKTKNSTQMSKWKPSESEEAILKRHKNFIRVLPPSRDLRGMINLGDTCYMSCIMQVLLHTHILRDYFFADKHECHDVKSDDCLVCILYKLFQKYYSDETSCLSLDDLLYFFWKKNYFAKNEQMDAHEFFVVLLNLLHQSFVPLNSNSEGCMCITDLIFHGKIQSDLICQSCFNRSTKVDPIKYLTLDIPIDITPLTLFECFNHSMRTESLAIRCSTCQELREVTKQMSLNTLPLVLIFHLNRFGDFGKINTLVSFPLELDMSSHMPGYEKSSSQQILASNEISDNHYSLYAVVQHKGELDKGHYITYIRKTPDIWFECNDHNVRSIGIKDVLGLQVFLLFYQKTVLNYV